MKLTIVILSVLFAARFEVEAFPALYSLTSLIETAFDIYGKLNDVRGFIGEFGDPESSIDDVLTAMSKLDDKLDKLGTRLARKMDEVLDTMLDRLPEITDIKSDMRLLRDHTMRIDSLYNNFKIYSGNLSKCESATLHNFAETVTDHSPGSVRNVLDSIFNIIIPRRSVVFKASLLVRLSQEMQKRQRDGCDEEKTAQLQLFDVYTAILITEMRGFLVEIFSYNLRSSFIDNHSNITASNSKRHFIVEIELAERSFRQRVAAYTYSLQQAMRLAPRTLRRCDPSKKHVRGKTFHEFEKFMYAFVIREKALNPAHLCDKTCDSIDKVELTQTVSYYDKIEIGRSSHSCFGTVTNCKSAGGGIDVCVSWWMNQKDSMQPKRYAWFRDLQGNTYGNADDGCGGLYLYYGGEIEGVNYCDICVCTCVEDSYLQPATRFISLLPVVSIIRKNKVVTGLKFISSENVIQIQIQEGKLAKDGTIDEATVSWQVPNRFYFMIVSSMQEKKHVFKLRWADGQGISPLEFNKHVTSFTHQNRTINLDALNVPKDHVMTGIKFDQVTGKSPNSFPIQLSIRATPFDYDTGVLTNIRSSVWITPENMKDTLTAYAEKRTEITYPDDAMDPTEKVMETTPSFQPNKWIKIRNSGLKSDAGQTVIPLLDGLDVTVDPPLPLTGVNLFHKAAENYGGFLSFQITTIDMTKHMVHLGTRILKRHNYEDISEKRELTRLEIESGPDKAA